MIPMRTRCGVTFAAAGIACLAARTCAAPTAGRWCASFPCNWRPAHSMPASNTARRQQASCPATPASGRSEGRAHSQRPSRVPSVAVAVGATSRPGGGAAPGSQPRRQGHRGRRSAITTTAVVALPAVRLGLAGDRGIIRRRARPPGVTTGAASTHCASRLRSRYKPCISLSPEDGIASVIGRKTICRRTLHDGYPYPREATSSEWLSSRLLVTTFLPSTFTASGGLTNCNPR